MTPQQTDTTILARLQPSAPRRVVGVAVLGGLGLFFLGVATRSLTGTPVAMLTFLAMGALILWLAVRLWASTANGLVLTGTELRDTTGQVLARVDQIRSVERGVFAFKPAGGFTLVTSGTAGARAWAPGLWWRAGNRIGVGGVTHRHEGRYMAEVLSEMIGQK